MARAEEKPLRSLHKLAKELSERSKKNNNPASAKKAASAAESMELIIAQKDILRREAFSNMQLARRKARGPISSMEKKLFLLTKNLRRGDIASFRSKSGNTYTGKYIGTAIKIVEKGRDLAEVPCIRIKQEDNQINLLRIDLLEKRLS